MHAYIHTYIHTHIHITMIFFASKPAPQQLAWPWLASGGAASSSGGLRRAFGLRRAPAGARGEMVTDSLGMMRFVVRCYAVLSSAMPCNGMMCEYIYTCIYTYMDTWIHTYRHRYIHRYVRTFFQVVCPSWIDPDAWRSASLAFFRTSVLVTELFHELRNSSKLRPLKGTARKKIVNS